MLGNTSPVDGSASLEGRELLSVWSMQLALKRPHQIYLLLSLCTVSVFVCVSVWLCVCTCASHKSTHPSQSNYLHIKAIWVIESFCVFNQIKWDFYFLEMWPRNSFVWFIQQTATIRGKKYKTNHRLLFTGKWVSRLKVSSFSRNAMLFKLAKKIEL